MDIQPSIENKLKLLPLFTGVFCGLLLISNVTAVKVIPFIGSLTIVGGTLVFPLIYIFNDILTEVYGYQLSRRVIWTGFLVQILAVLYYTLVGILPSAPFWHNQAAYDSILGIVPRIAVASLSAYFLGEFTNSFVLSKMKYIAQGKRGFSQAWRFIASTIVGEAVDSSVFIVVAFAGIFSGKELFMSALGIYIFKVIYEIVVTPITVRFANWVKKIEGVDHIDIPDSTNYNPLAIFK